jgi:hypothetical protein
MNTPTNGKSARSEKTFNNIAKGLTWQCSTRNANDDHIETDTSEILLRVSEILRQNMTR